MGWKQRTTNRNPVRVDTPAAITPALLGATAAFGLIPNLSHESQPKQIQPSDETLHRILKQHTVLLRGASGSGKSSTIRGIYSRLKKMNRTVHTVGSTSTRHDEYSSIFDLLRDDPQSRASALSYAGLAEPKLWALPFHCLSEGQQARFEMALVIQRAKQGDVIIADEFGTPLDRVSAYSFARTVQRWAIQQRVTLICATAHEDMEAMLSPDLVLDLDSQTHRLSCPRIDQKISIEAGTYADYRSLAHLHYLGADPATSTLILRATRQINQSTSVLAGVLVVSIPTLNGSWRKRAWPNYFNSGSKSDDAKTINAQLRYLSRVIIDPRSRGLGIATQLVQEYIKNPQTPCTEALAAMGSVCPFLERAGMRPYKVLPTTDDLRLLDAIEHHNMSITDLIKHPIDHRSHIGSELIRWGKRRRIQLDDFDCTAAVERIAPIAACRLIAQPRAYAHTNTHHVEKTGDQ